MPRIANIGDLDWDLNPLGDLGHFYSCEHLCLRLVLDTKLQNKSDHGRDFEVVTFTGSHGGVTPGYNTKFQYTADREKNHFNVFEEDTWMLPSLARELGRFLAKESPSAFVVSVIFQDGDLQKVRYVINQVDGVEHPTQFINSFVRKVNKWVKENGLDRYPFLPYTDYAYMVNHYTCVRTIRGDTDMENLERLVLKLRRVTGQAVEWAPFRDTVNDRPHYRIYAIGNNVFSVRKELDKILGVQAQQEKSL